jgi:hypothetical protein
VLDISDVPPNDTYTSNDSFQYGFSVFLIAEVVLVCSPSTVNTANGSGNPSSQKES